jgi:hypothetical protein
VNNNFIKLLQEILATSKTPEEYNARLDELADKLKGSEQAIKYIDDLHRIGLAQKARKDSPEGYAAFYELIHGFPPPLHIMREIEVIYKAHNQGIGSVIFAWRGSWKSVSISVTFLAYRIGLEPHKTNMVVSANDDSAEKVTKAVAAIIELHPEWKRVFPNIVPDSGKWSVEGFYVVDNSMPKDEWVKRQAGVIDPTLIGGGYKSSRLIGKHPSGVLDIDDIHDRDNSSSEKERRVVVDILGKTILKTVVKENDKMSTWLVAVGTPWAVDDAYYTMKNTGQYEFIAIPAMTRASEGKGTYVDGVNRNGMIFDDIVGWWDFTFPKNFGVTSVIKERADGKQSFWQMIMLDLAASSSGSLRYYPFPHTEIKSDWYMVGGADPTNTVPDKDAPSPRSHFALAYVAKKPSGGAVIVGGVLEQCSQLAAENHILIAQDKFPNWTYTAVENVGGGAGFLQTLHRNPKIKAIASGLKGISDARIHSKKDRILEMSRWFDDGTVTISDEDTPFLNALRRLFQYIHDLDPKSAPEFDAGDATYHALRQMPDVLRVEMVRQNLTQKRAMGLQSAWSRL